MKKIRIPHYALLIALIALAILAAVTLFRGSLDQVVTTIANLIGR